MTIHEDDRRILKTWPEAKIIIAKKDCIVGEHYHKIKTEQFIVLNGDIKMFTANGMSTQMEIGKMYTIEPLQWHSFGMKKDSIMLGLCSHEYNHNDDYK